MNELIYNLVIKDITAKPRKNTINFKNLRHNFATIILIFMMFFYPALYK